MTAAHIRAALDNGYRLSPAAYAYLHGLRDDQQAATVGTHDPGYWDRIRRITHCVLTAGTVSIHASLTDRTPR